MDVSINEQTKAAVRQNVHEVQNSIPVSEEVYDALCSICGQRTYLPVEYMESLRQANYITMSLCDDCLVNESGHADCEAIDCRRCPKVAEELDKRAVVKEEFANGTLIIVDDDEDVIVID